MKLKEIGEFGFIDRFSPLFAGIVPDKIRGIGDDCAVMPLNDQEDLIVTTDLLVEDVHFLKNRISPFQLGHKSLAVNLSDIAAMGGTPFASFLSIAIPSDTDVEFLDEVMRGYKSISEKYGVPLLGGDTTKSPDKLTINVCVLGKCEKNRAVLRNTAIPGDIVCVTGYLGDSAAGLKASLKGISGSEDADYLTDRHYMPSPRLKEGRLLASLPGVNSMMDISDGLSSDLMQILKASGKSAVVDIELIPVSPQLLSICRDLGWNSFDLAVSGGEDYELLCTISTDKFEGAAGIFEKQCKKKLFKVGEIKHGVPVIEWKKGGQSVIVDNKGFDHFL